MVPHLAPLAFNKSSAADMSAPVASWYSRRLSAALLYSSGVKVSTMSSPTMANQAIAIPKGMKDQIKEHAAQMGDKSANAFINRAINETMERDIAATE